MKRLAALLILLLAAGCIGQPDPAEVATYKAIAPEYRDYVTADPGLSLEQKERRFRTLERWAAALQIPEEDR